MLPDQENLRKRKGSDFFEQRTSRNDSRRQLGSFYRMKTTKNQQKDLCGSNELVQKKCFLIKKKVVLKSRKFTKKAKEKLFSNREIEEIIQALFEQRA